MKPIQNIFSLCLVYILQYVEWIAQKVTSSLKVSSECDSSGKRKLMRAGCCMSHLTFICTLAFLNVTGMIAVIG